VKAIWAPGTASGNANTVDLSKGTMLEDLSEPEVVRDIGLKKEFRDVIVKGLSRVITGPGVTSDFYHKTTGENLFRSYPYERLPIAGKTGTAQGAFNLPWNDSSAFAAFSKTKTQPYTAVAYVEKAGFGSRAAAPIVKCIFLVFAGRNPTTRALPSDPLDPTGFAVAEPQRLRRPACLGGAGSSVRD